MIHGQCEFLCGWIFMFLSWLFSISKKTSRRRRINFLSWLFSREEWRENSMSSLVEGEEYDRAGEVEVEEYDSEVEGEEDDDRDGR